MNKMGSLEVTALLCVTTPISHSYLTNLLLSDVEPKHLSDLEVTLPGVSQAPWTYAAETTSPMPWQVIQRVYISSLEGLWHVWLPGSLHWLGTSFIGRKLAPCMCSFSSLCLQSSCHKSSSAPARSLFQCLNAVAMASQHPRYHSSKSVHRDKELVWGPQDKLGLRVCLHSFPHQGPSQKLGVLFNKTLHLLISLRLLKSVFLCGVHGWPLLPYFSESIEIVHLHVCPS